MSRVVVTMMVMALVTQSLLMVLASTSQHPLHLEREAAARDWSPLVWLHPGEDYFPSSVPFFLQHITPSTGHDQAELQQGSAAQELNLPSGRPSREFFLLAPHNFGCVDCTLPGFLHGQKPQKKYSPPVYVTIHSCSPLPSARAVRSTQNSIMDDDLINLDTYNDVVAEDTTTTSFSHTDHTPTFFITNPTMQPNISYSLQNISSQFNQTQPTETHSPVSTLGATNPVHISYEESSTTTYSSICINNATLCPTNKSEEMLHKNVKNIQITDDVNNVDTTNMGAIDNLLLNTTVTPYTNESQTKHHNFTEFQTSSRSQQYNTQVNDTNDLGNTSTLTSLGQNHNNEKRHARPSTNRHQLFLSEQQYTVTYWMFYPYNRGKKVCTINLGFIFGQMFKFKVNGVCHGEEITLGNHVGDWEHISIQFSGSRPSRMYVSSHTFGAYYTYDAQHHSFVYQDEDTREGIPLSPVYPKTIHLTESHPILYSARGSHGLWGAEGIHQYNSLPKLQDETGKGTPWKTWKNLKLIDVQDPISVQPHGRWWKYEGRWGNPSTKCHVLLAGVCEHVKGPTGIPRKRVNFPCQNI